MQVAAVRELSPGERRVAITPATVALLAKRNLVCQIESGAGIAAGYADADYVTAGATVVADRAAVLRGADILLQVAAAGTSGPQWRDDVSQLRSGAMVIGMADPWGDTAALAALADRGVSLMSMELLPRITRAQSMDVLSSQATIAGYRAVLLAAMRLPKLMPMLMTAAGTLTPAKTLVIGAGVAGLQAIATARRLGAMVQGYDVRAAAREQIESLGAKCVTLDLGTSDAEGGGGYARALSADEQQRQREQLGLVVAECDVVISTAAIPGKPSPRLIDAAAVRRMAAGSVVIDLAAARGGNCELTQADTEVVDTGVTILGPTNLASEVPQHASQMYAKNLLNLVTLLTSKTGELALDSSDAIVRDMLVTHAGVVLNPSIRERLGLAPLDPPAAPTPPATHLAGTPRT